MSFFFSELMKRALKVSEGDAPLTFAECVAGFHGGGALPGHHARCLTQIPYGSCIIMFISMYVYII